jgi:hypothetical protein
VKDLSKEEFEEKRKRPDDEKEPPEVIHDGEYWPNGHGKTQLDRFRASVGKREILQEDRSPTTSDSQKESQQKRNPTTIGFVKRAERPGSPICSHGEDCYPYAWPIDQMYDSFKEATW